jgi:predicted dehydrogenase
MINAAIVGLGKWGQNLVNSVQGKSDKIRFTTGVLRHPDKAREYADSQGIRLLDDYRKALADPSIDAVVLATPHTVHAEQIVAAARAGKPVFTEKPLALTSRSSATAVKACAEAGVTLAVGYNWRFQPALQEIKRMLADGRLGKLMHIEGNFCGPSVYRFSRDHWRQQRDEGPAGGMTGRGVHVLDAMMYLSGQVDSVHAQSLRLAQDFGIDDTTSMLLKFKGGSTGYLGTFIATAETWRMQVFGSKGWAQVGDVEHLTTWDMQVCYVDPKNLTTHHKPQRVTFPAVSTERVELEHFAEAVAAGRPLALPGGDEDHSSAVLEAIVESARTRQTVALAAPAPKASRREQPAKKTARAPARKAAKRKSAKPARKTAPRGKAPRRSKVSGRRSGRR